MLEKTSTQSVHNIVYHLLCHKIDPCSTYTQIDDTMRSIYSTDKTQILSDAKVVNNTWYRFNGIDSKMIVTSPIEMMKCGAISPGWLAVNHPQGMTVVMH